MPGSTYYPPFAAGNTTMANAQCFSLASDNPAIAVSGTFWQATQPISGTVTINAIPTGTNTIGSVKITDGTNTAAVLNAAPGSDTGQSALAVRIISQLGAGSGGGGIQYVNGVANAGPTGTLSLGYDGANLRALKTATDGTVKVDGSGFTQPVSGTFWQSTQPISGTVTINAIPTGSNSIGTVGLNSGTNVIGHVIVDSGAITANAGTNLNTSALALDATLTGGTTKCIARGGAKGSTTAADITSISVDANTQALHVNVTNFPASQVVTGTFFQATQPVSIASMPSTPVTGTFWQATQPVSGTVSINAIPTGSNVIGHVIVDSGAITANAGTNLNTSALALESGGNLATLSAKDFATQTTLAALNTKIPASPATEGGNLATIAAKDFSTSAKQDTGNTSLAAIKIDLDQLNVAQAAVLGNQTGPVIMATVNDTPNSFIDNTIQPLSITPEGRLRVDIITTASNRVWNTTFDNPWEETDDNLSWTTKNLYV